MEIFFSELIATLPLEKIKFAIRGKLPICDSIWGPFSNFLANKDLSCVVETNSRVAHISENCAW